jgi:hypothetical protein
MMITTTRLGIAGLAVAAALAPVRQVQACGGFFCNQPDSPFGPLPVAQTAENVLFAVDPDPSGKSKLEAHVQIFYTGPVDRFSWVVPVDGKPTLGVGSNQMFAVLDQQTKPQFQLNWHDEGTCRDDGSQDDHAGDAGGASAKSAGGPPQAAERGGVEVAFKGDVGPYDAAVVRSTDPKDPRALKEWLAENKYFVSDDAGRLIDDYVKEEKWFVAIRLQSGKGVSEIAPLTMKFDGPGPCVPLRLTSIAALKDLRINLWVLGKDRAVPENFLELKVNPARIDWIGGGRNYDDLLKRAADEAGGNAFAVDYAGPARLMAGTLYKPGQYNIARLADARTPPEALNEIGNQGIPRDATLLDLLRKYIPEPAELKAMNIAEQQFYNQLANYWQTYGNLFAPFDARAFAAEVDEKMLKPLEQAQALFDRYPKLTRLSTFISPEEMTVDPMFAFNTTLPDVPVTRMAQAFRLCGDRAFTTCDAPVRIELPGGQKVMYRPTMPGTCEQDRKAFDSLPALEQAWKREPVGEGAVRFDNRVAIKGAVGEHNKTVDDFVAQHAGCSCMVGGRRGAATAVFAGVGLARAAIAMRRRQR